MVPQEIPVQPQIIQPVEVPPQPIQQVIQPVPKVETPVVNIPQQQVVAQAPVAPMTQSMGAGQQTVTSQQIAAVQPVQPVRVGTQQLIPAQQTSA